MSSFINLMANDIWSEADIKSRLHAEIRSEISEQSETELNRALQGKILGIYTLSKSEIALLEKFKTVVQRITILGSQVRLDSLLLFEVIAHEKAVARLSLEAVSPSPAPPDNADGTVVEFIDTKYIEDVAERLEAEAVVASASPDVLTLNLLRNPVEEIYASSV